MYNPQKPRPPPILNVQQFCISSSTMSRSGIFSQIKIIQIKTVRAIAALLLLHTTRSRNDKRRCQVFATILPPIVKIITTPFSEDVVLSDLLKNTVKKLQKKKNKQKNIAPLVKNAWVKKQR